MNKLEHIEGAKEIAILHGGKCLSSSSYGVNVKLSWRCKNNHEWFSTLKCIRLGSWCPTCAREKSRTNIEIIKKKASDNGGNLISLVFKNKDSKLEWECIEKHRWFAKWKHIKNGSWCPFCAKVAKITYDDAVLVAVNNFGFFISNENEIINNRSLLKWKCNKEHIWKASYSNVSRGTWCPVCQVGKTERFCRETMENIFGVKFPKIKPTWLIGPKGYPLELDGYNEELCIAFEYNGLQHYEAVYDNQDLEYQKQKDRLKVEICKLRGVSLVVIETIRYPTKKLINFIVENKIKEMGIFPKGIKINE